MSIYVCTYIFIHVKPILFLSVLILISFPLQELFITDEDWKHEDKWGEDGGDNTVVSHRNLLEMVTDDVFFF